MNKDIETLYNDFFNKYGTGLLKAKQKYTTLNIIFFIFLFIAILFTILSIVYGYEVYLVIMTGLYIVTLIFAFMNVENKRKYLRLYKENVFTYLINKINSKLQVKCARQNRDEIQKLYNDAKFRIYREHMKILVQDVEETYETFSATEYAEGEINENQIVKIANVYVYRRIDHYENNGWFISLNSITNVKNMVNIKTYFDKFDKTKNKMLSDIECFDKLFLIKSDNDFILSRILTPDMKRYLMDFIQKTGIGFEIVLKNDNIYIRFYTSYKFEPNMKNKEACMNQMYNQYYLVKLIMDFVNKIDSAIKEIDV